MKQDIKSCVADIISTGRMNLYGQYIELTEDELEKFKSFYHISGEDFNLDDLEKFKEYVNYFRLNNCSDPSTLDSWWETYASGTHCNSDIDNGENNKNDKNKSNTQTFAYLNKLKNDKTQLYYQRAYMIVKRIVNSYKGISLNLLINYADKFTCIRGDESYDVINSITDDLLDNLMTNTIDEIEYCISTTNNELNILKDREPTPFSINAIAKIEKIKLPKLQKKLNYYTSPYYKEDLIAYIERGFNMMCEMFDIPTDYRFYSEALNSFVNKFIRNTEHGFYYYDARYHMSEDIKYKYLLNVIKHYSTTQFKNICCNSDSSFKFCTNMKAFKDIFINTNSKRYKEYILGTNIDILSDFYSWLHTIVETKENLSNSIPETHLESFERNLEVCENIQYVLYTALEDCSDENHHWFY